MAYFFLPAVSKYPEFRFTRIVPSDKLLHLADLGRVIHGNQYDRNTGVLAP